MFLLVFMNKMFILFFYFSISMPQLANSTIYGVKGVDLRRSREGKAGIAMQEQQQRNGERGAWWLLITPNVIIQHGNMWLLMFSETVARLHLLLLKGWLAGGCVVVSP
jgi:hypothetical protein